MRDSTIDRQPPTSDSSILPALRRRRSLYWVLALGAVGIAAVIAFLPTIIARTSLRNWLLQRMLDRPRLAIECDHLQLGWWSPIHIEGMRIRLPDQQPILEVESIRGSRSLGQILSDPSDLGTFVVDQSRVHVVLLEGDTIWQALKSDRPRPHKRPRPLWQLEIHDAEFVAYEQWQGEPLAHVIDVDLVVSSVRQEDGTEMLTCQLAQPLARIPLSVPLCHLGLRYVAPVLAAAAWTDGQFSLTIDECRVPLETPALATVQGQLVLHSVRAGLKPSLLRDITRLSISLAHWRLPEYIRIVDESTVPFVLRDRRVHHEGLAIGFPDAEREVLVRSSGYVGLDETLEIELQVPVPLDLLSKGPLAQAVSREDITVLVTGTFDDPDYSLQGDGHIVSSIIGRLLEKSDKSADDSAGGDSNPSLGELLERLDLREAAGAVGQAGQRLRSRIRERRQQRRLRQQEETQQTP